MKIDISDGELLDKVTILQIKSEKITDDNKLKNVLTELNHLLPYKNDIVAKYDISDLYLSLLAINTLLWKIEDDIRDKERNKIFDEEFVELARSVYMTNDERSRIKKLINQKTKSAFVEEKSYEEY
jgi:hypothetical protein